jgi:hypothetical protein
VIVQVLIALRDAIDALAQEIVAKAGKTQPHSQYTLSSAHPPQDQS